MKGKEKAKKVKELSNGLVYSITDKNKIPYSVVSTGIIGLNKALGLGGFPRGRIVEIFGQESTGKTTIGWETIAQCQYLGGIGGYVDAENSGDYYYAENLGVDTDSLLVSEPESGEKAFEAIEYMCNKRVDVIVVDSVAGMVPQAELDGNYGDSKMGLHARMMAQGLRKVKGIVKKNNLVLIFINHEKETMGGSGFSGVQKYTPGGRALKMFASIRLECWRKQAPNRDSNKKAISSEIRVTVSKNKCAPPFQTCQFNIIYGYGVDRLDELSKYLVENKVITQRGSWYYHGKEALGQGMDNVLDYCEDNYTKLVKLI